MPSSSEKSDEIVTQKPTKTIGETNEHRICLPEYMAPFRIKVFRSPRPPLTPASGKAGGFALIVSLSLMAVVLLAVILLAGQVRMGIAGSSSETDRIRARESARLAFAVALGELQQAAGPDQRVTARAEIAYADSELVESRKYNTGVWDSRNELAAPVSWLVSGGVEPNAPVGADDVFVLDEGDVPGLPASDRVHAPFVPVTPEQRIAWWVGDEGVKASVKRIGNESRSPLGADFSNRFVRSINMMGGAFRSGFEVLAREMLPSDDEAGFDQLTQGDAVRRMMGAEDLLKILPANSEFKPGQFHSLTTVSAGVLSNTLEGGLRRNLDPVLESPQTGGSDPFLNGDLIPYIDVDSNYATFSDPSGIMGTMTGLDFRDNSSVGWDRPGQNQIPTAPADGFRAYHHLSPVVTEAAIYFTVFQRLGKPAIRFYMDVELWNPYPFPLLISTGDTRALTVLVEGLPEIRITQFNGADEYVSDSGWVGIDNVPLSSGVRETGSWLQIDTRGRKPWPQTQPAFLMPGETYRLEDPDPRHQAQGLWKNMGNIGPENVANTDKILVEGRAPGGEDVGRMSLRLVRGNSQGSGGNRRLPGDPPLFEVLNIPYEGDPALFRWGPTRADGRISSRPRRFGTKKYIFGSGTGNDIEVRESYIFALHFGLESEDAGDLSTFFENFDFRYPRIDFSEQLETPEGSLPMSSFIRTAGADPVNGNPMNPRLVESQIDNVFPLGPNEIFKDGEVREQDPEPASSISRYADVRLLDAPPLTRPNSLAGFRHAFFVGEAPLSLTSPSGGTINEAFDRYFLSTVPDSGWVPDDGVMLPNPWLSPIDSSSSVDELRAEDAAGRFRLDGAFNLNSTSVGAWRAMLSQRTADDELVFRSHDLNRVGTMELDNFFSRSPSGALHLTPGLIEDEIRGLGTLDRKREQLRHTYRTLSDEQIHHLSHHITRLLRERGHPFRSLSSFMNSGLLDEAIEAVGPAVPEAGLASVEPINENREGYEPTFLRQSDIISLLAPVQSVRSDTFTIRVAAETTDTFTDEKTLARLVGTVQRLPDSAIKGGDPMGNHDNSFGRRFAVTNLQWLKN